MGDAAAEKTARCKGDDAAAEEGDSTTTTTSSSSSSSSSNPCSEVLRVRWRWRKRRRRDRGEAATRWFPKVCGVAAQRGWRTCSLSLSSGGRMRKTGTLKSLEN